MYKYILDSVEGVEWFGIVALLIFFATFCMAFYRAYFSKAIDSEYMSRMPLED